MTAARYPYTYTTYPPGPPPPAPRRKPRWWLVGIMVAWGVLLAALGFWAVGHEPPTVPEQRSIAQALPALERATGAMLSAAQGPGRVVLLHPVRLEPGCRITAVRSGVEGIRDVTVYVPAGRVTTALEAVAKALPAAYRADVATKGPRVGLHADAGSYVGIDADTLTNAQMFTLEASTGCRPSATVDTAAAEPAAGEPPAALTAVLRALKGSGEPAVTAVACPNGRTAAAYTVDRVPRAADLGRSLEPVISGATVVRADPDGWAYRTGSESIVVAVLGTALRVTATTAC